MGCGRMLPTQGPPPDDGEEELVETYTPPAFYRQPGHGTFKNPSACRKTGTRLPPGRTSLLGRPSKHLRPVQF